MEISKINTYNHITEAESVAPKMAEKIDSNSTLGEFCSKLKQSQGSDKAIQMLKTAVVDGVLEQKNGVLFKHKDYTIQCMLKYYADSYLRNAKFIDSLNLSTAPEIIDVFEKDEVVFILSKLNGTTEGDLIPYQQAKSKVSKEDKMAAFKDLQKLVKSGHIDNNIAEGRLWFVTPDDNKIMFPSWEAVRPLDKNEGDKILNECYNRLFKY